MDATSDAGGMVLGRGICEFVLDAKVVLERWDACTRAEGDTHDLTRKKGASLSARRFDYDIQGISSYRILDWICRRPI